jgi:DnaJ family protein C protein 7
VQQLKEWQKAIEDCERALKLDPSYTKARKTKAKALGESGDWEQAVKELKAIAESNPEEPGIAKEIRNAELELKKSKRKDYYKILGVEKDADDNQIKKAYRKLAIIHHPDKVCYFLFTLYLSQQKLTSRKTEPRRRSSSRPL